MADDNATWEQYYKKIAGRQPRQLLLDVLEKFQVQQELYAIDLGCGDGTETAALLARGWKVLAIDGEPASLKYLMEKIPKEDQVRLQTLVSKFEEVILPASDLIHASYSIPFCHPDHFPALWNKISDSIHSGGRFAGQFFGVRDSWADNKDMTFHTEEQVRAMLKEFEIEFFHEEDADEEAASGPKHWHVFTLIAKKN